MPTNRIEAFSDGVFAIAVTLLVLEIRLPEHDGSLTERLGDAWPAYVAYGISFVTLGIMWANHHTIFSLIDRSSHGLVVANLLLLLCVAFLPFPTSVLGEHLQGSDAEQHTAVVFYGASFAVTAAFYNVLWQTAAWRNRLIAPGAEAQAEQVTRSYRYGVPVYALAAVVGFWSVPLSLAIDGALAFLYILPQRDPADDPSREGARRRD